MAKNLLETLLGAVVLVVAGMFVVFAYSTASVRPVRGYEVVAKFDRVEGVNIGTDVKMSGIKIGTVIDQRLDTTTFVAVLRMSIDSKIKLPADTSAQISTEGLLGGTFVALVPGGEDKTIPPGGEIKFTESSMNIGQLVRHFIYGTGPKPGEQKPESKN